MRLSLPNESEGGAARLTSLDDQMCARTCKTLLSMGLEDHTTVQTSRHCAAAGLNVAYIVMVHFT